MKKLTFAAVALAAGTMFANTTPVMVSLVTPVQAPARDWDVAGLRLSLIYGQCQNMTGLDLGLGAVATDDFVGLGIDVVNYAGGDSAGVGIGGVNVACGDLTGLDVGGVNYAGGAVCGGQLGLVNWNGNKSAAWSERSVGAQIGVVNYAGAFCGLQEGFVNVSDVSFAGLQSGFVNCAADVAGLECGAYFLLGLNFASGTVRGCQIGLVNYAARMEKGLQIGFVNIIGEGGWLPVLPIVNGSF